MISAPDGIGRLERFFEEVDKPATDPSSPPLFEKEDLESLLAAAPRYGVEILSSEPQLDFKAITGNPVNRDKWKGRGPEGPRPGCAGDR